MSDENTGTDVPTGDLLGLGLEGLVKLREKNEKVDRRSRGVVFNDNFQVTAEQDAADKELVKQTYSEVQDIASFSEESRTQEDGKKAAMSATAVDDTTAPTVIPSLDDIEKKYMDIARFKIFQLAGDDVMGRPVIAFSACRLPIKDLIDHQRLLEFAKSTLDNYVVNDYTLIYFHYGLGSHNKPSFHWLLQIYRELDRKYKKNIKAFYIVHPSNFIRVAYTIMSPFLSKKFGKKIHHIARLDDLAPFVHLGQLDIPKEVRDHDEELIAKSKVKPTTSNMSSFYISPELPSTQQFGVSLRWLIENNGADPIPKAIKTCVSFLREHGLTTEGIFRRSPLNSTVQELKREFNLGLNVNLDPSDVHAPAVLIKRFLREMPEPLLTFEFYDTAMDICTLNQEERVERMRTDLKRCLPHENYVLLTYIVDFLEQVVNHSAENKMSTGNLAIIFGPNLIWSKNDTTSLTTMAKVNTFTKALLDHSKEILYDRSLLDSC